MTETAQGDKFGDFPKNLTAENSWLVGAIGNALQALSAFQSFAEPYQAVIFWGVWLSVFFYTYRQSATAGKQLPIWFVLAALATLLIFVTKDEVAELISKKSSVSAAAVSDVADIPIPPTTRFFEVLTYLDADGNGRMGDDELVLPDIPFRYGDGGPKGMNGQNENHTGRTPSLYLSTTGDLNIVVCGVSQSHRLTDYNASSSRALPIKIGVPPGLIKACREK